MITGFNEISDRMSIFVGKFFFGIYFHVSLF